ncbi:hypothetical protein EYF80_031885 [Liparis tanakae]|uniref:Uncharacterized protein n=1 Tax=Liparis tanakae TaxID=230148 RepID=A0A4Z2GWJ1_9TELE|nr:hypothetical protein EYF80_031885 [Liparis tanakae]
MRLKTARDSVNKTLPVPGVRVPLWSAREFPGFEAGSRSTEVTEEDTCRRNIWAEPVVTRWDVTDERSLEIHLIRGSGCSCGGVCGQVLQEGFTYSGI